MNQLVKVKFTRKMHAFLIRDGFTHVYNRGLLNISGEFIDDNEEYVIIPLKEGDPKFQHPSTQLMIEEIIHPEVWDMAKGDTFIRFSVELQSTVYEKFSNGFH